MRAGMFAAVGAAISTSASAGVLFDSLDSHNTGAVAFNFPSLNASFQTGSSPVRVSDVTLLLNSASSSAGDTFTVSLMGGVPLADVSFINSVGLNVDPDSGAVLGAVTLPVSDLSSALTAEHFSQFDGIALKADSFYWISLAVSGFDANAGWGVTNDDSGVGVSLGYNASQITDGGFFPNAPTPPPNNGGPIFQMEVGASAPEPATWALMLVGLASLGILGRRRVA